MLGACTVDRRKITQIVKTLGLGEPKASSISKMEGSKMEARFLGPMLLGQL